MPAANQYKKKKKISPQKNYKNNSQLPERNGHASLSAIGGGIHEGSRLYPRAFRTSEVLGNFNLPPEELISANDRRQLVNKSRFYYENVAPVKAVVDDIATYSIGDSWMPTANSPDAEWNRLAIDWLSSWFTINNPYKSDFVTDLWLCSTALDRDGDLLLHLTYANDGQYPLVEFVGANAIGTRDDVIEAGVFSGYKCIDGVIVNDNNIPIGYNLLGKTKDEDEQLSVQDAMLYFEPKYPRQLRGFPGLSTSLLDWSSFRDIKDFQKIGIEMLSSLAFVEKNEQGGLTPGSFISTGGNNFTSSNAAGYPLYYKEIKGGTVKLYGSNDPNTGIQPIDFDRPGTNTNDFLNNTLIRGGINSLGWPCELSWNIAGLNTSNVKAIFGKADRKVRNRQATIYKVWKRVVVWGLAKAIKLGLLPPMENFWKYVEPNYPKLPSSDMGREAQTDTLLLRNCGTTLNDIYGKQGENSDQKIVQRVSEVRKIMDECDRQNVPLPLVFSPFPNAQELTAPNQQPNQQANATEE